MSDWSSFKVSVTQVTGFLSVKITLFLNQANQKKISVKGYKALQDSAGCTWWQQFKTEVVWTWHVNRDDTILSYSFCLFCWLIFLSDFLEWGMLDMLWLFKMKYWSNPRVAIRKNKLSFLTRGTWRKALSHHSFSYSKLFITQRSISAYVIFLRAFIQRGLGFFPLARQM